MKDMSLTNLQAGVTMISAAAIQVLAGRLRGRVLNATDATYDEARTIWNAMIDRRPGLIVQCAGAADVVNAVRFAAENHLLVAVRGGGHNIAGNAVCDGGLMIDLTPMKSVRVDATTKRAWVEPGATLADVDKETQAFRLALPTGINSTTGIAGLTLGGGFGWITRKFGLTIDNLLSADVVTASGELVRASPTEHRDLFWGLRGGGGNFGVVTAFEFELHDLGPEVLSGLVVHPFADAESVLQQYRQALENAPDELTCWVVMRQAPPLPFLPAEWHGKEVLVLAMCYCGDLEAGEKATAGLRAIGRPIADVVAPHLGAITFIIGETGSGKSTVLRLALKTVEPSKGQIRVDGVDLFEVNRRDWYASVGIVPQEVMLLNDTLAANIALGRPIDQQRLRVAAAKAAILNRIEEFPDGFSTIVGERGLKLSGGERQRIAIARALYGEPKFLLLDEASSALDEATEAAIMDHIRRVAGEVTVLAITHRKCTIRQTDNVIDLSDRTRVTEGV